MEKKYLVVSDLKTTCTRGIISTQRNSPKDKNKTYLLFFVERKTYLIIQSKGFTYIPLVK